MMRLIDADKLEELCNIMADKCDGIGESIWNQFRTTVEWSPTVDAVEAPRWIPVTERLPNANEKKYRVRRYYLVQNEYGDMMVASWNGVVWEQMYRYKPVEDKVVAWMPLPKPWKGEDDDTD